MKFHLQDSKELVLLHADIGCDSPSSECGCSSHCQILGTETIPELTCRSFASWLYCQQRSDMTHLLDCYEASLTLARCRVGKTTCSPRDLEAARSRVCMIEGTCSTLVVGHDLAEAQERGPWHLAVLLCGFIPLEGQKGAWDAYTYSQHA
jgi:hypothetical protein